MGAFFKNKVFVIAAALVIVIAVAVVLTNIRKDSANDSAESGDSAFYQAEELINAAQKRMEKVSSYETGKEETIYVYAEADGSVSSIHVNERLKNKDGLDELEDESRLSDIKNTKGYEEYTIDASGKMVWAAEGNDIYYEGTLDEELPFSMKVTYYLDDEETDPESLAGKSGWVRIRFEYDISQMAQIEVGSKIEEVHIPFGMMTSIALPEDRFGKVTVNKGRVTRSGGNIMVTGMTIPYVESDINSDDDEDDSFFEVKAYTSGFELDETITYVMSDVMSEIDLFEDDDSGDLRESMNDLQEGMDDVEEGSYDLNDGIGELQSGASELAGGAEDLKKGTKELYDNYLDYYDAVNNLKSGIDELKEGGDSLSEGISQLSVLPENIESLSDALKSMRSSLETQYTYENGGKAPQTYSDSEKEEAAMQAALQAYSANPGDIGNYHLYMYYSVDLMVKGLPDSKALKEQVGQLSSGADALAGGLGEASTGIKQIRKASKSIKNGIYRIYEGNAQLADATDELSNGADALKSGSYELSKAIGELNESGVSEVTEELGSDMPDVMDRTNAIQELGEEYKNYAGAITDDGNSVTFVLVTESIENN